MEHLFSSENYSQEMDGCGGGRGCMAGCHGHCDGGCTGACGKYCLSGSSQWYTKIV